MASNSRRWPLSMMGARCVRYSTGRSLSTRRSMRWHLWNRGARRARSSSPCRSQEHGRQEAAVQRLVEAASPSEQLNLKLGTGPAWSILDLELTGLCALTSACSRRHEYDCAKDLRNERAAAEAQR